MGNSSSIRTGIIFCLLAVFIWGAWPVITAIGMKHSLTPYELIFLRAVVAGPLLLPFAFKGTHTRSEWLFALMLAVLAGAPYSIISTSGFLFAPANHGGVVIPGTLMLVSLVASHFWLNERFSAHRLAGALIITAGLVCLSAGASTGAAHKANSWIGDILFVTAGAMWGFYTFFLRLRPMDPLIVAARVSLLSMLMVLGYQIGWGPHLRFLELPTEAFVLQLVYQGLLSAVVALVLFNKGVAILGAGRASVLNSLIPAISIIMAVIVLGEIPNTLEQIGLATILCGIVLAVRSKAATLSTPAVAVER